MKGKIDIPLLLIVLLLMASLTAFFMDWIFYPVGIIVLGALLLLRISTLGHKP